MFEAFARIRSDEVPSRPAGCSKSRKIARMVLALPKAAPSRVYVAAGLVILLAGIGVNALFLQRQRHPAPLFDTARIASSARQGSHKKSDTPSVSDTSSPTQQLAAATPAVASPSSPTEQQFDRIGDLLRGEVQSRDTRVILAAQQALIKLGYDLKADGNDGSITRQAVLDFERLHGLPRTTEVTPNLVKQLTSALHGVVHGPHAPPL